MDFDANKTVLLEKKYLYVRATKGFQVEGTSTFRLPVQTGYYRFFVENLQRAIGNSYVTISYYSDDNSFYVSCDDTYMDEVQSSPVVAVESLEGVVSSGLSAIRDNQVSLSQGLSDALHLISGNQVYVNSLGNRYNLADILNSVVFSIVGANSGEFDVDTFLGVIDLLGGLNDVCLNILGSLYENVGFEGGLISASGETPVSLLSKIKVVQDAIQESLGADFGSGLSGALEAINTNLTAVLENQNSLLLWTLRSLRSSSNLAFFDSNLNCPGLSVLDVSFLDRGVSYSYALFGSDVGSSIMVRPTVSVYYCIYGFDGSLIRANYCSSSFAGIDLAGGWKLVVTRF